MDSLIGECVDLGMSLDDFKVIVEIMKSRREEGKTKKEEDVEEKASQITMGEMAASLKRIADKACVDLAANKTSVGDSAPQPCPPVRKLRNEVVIKRKTTVDLVFSFRTALCFYLGVWLKPEFWSSIWMASQLKLIDGFTDMTATKLMLLAVGGVSDLIKNGLLIETDDGPIWSGRYEMPPGISPDEFADENSMKTSIDIQLQTIEKNPGPVVPGPKLKSKEQKIVKKVEKAVARTTRGEKSLPAQKKEWKKNKKEMKEKVLKASGLSACDASEQKAVRQAVKAYKTMCDPEHNSTIRWADPTNAYPTAVFNPFVAANVPFGTASDYSTPALSQIFVMRDPLHAYVYKDDSSIVNGNSATYSTYQMYGVDNSAGSITSSAPTATWQQTLSYAVPYAEYLNIPYGQPLANPLHGSIWFAYSSKQVPKGKFFWCDKQTSVAFMVTSVSTGQTFTINADCWDRGEVSPNVLNSTSSASNSVGQTLQIFGKLPGSPAGYYCFKLSSNVAGTVAMSCLTVQNSGSIMCHRCIPDLDYLYPVIQGLRVISASVLFSARGQELYKGGKIVMAQIGAEGVWQDYLGSNAYSLISAVKNGSGDLAGATGAYGFLKPNNVSDLAMKTPFKTVGNTILDLVCDLEDMGSFLVLVGDFEIATERDYMMRFAFGIEMMTASTWFDLGVSYTSSRAMEMAMDQLKVTKQFMENPLHLRDIWESSKKLAVKAYKLFDAYGPEIAEAFAGLL